MRYFYPRSPCGERLLLMWYQCNTVVISIHALLAESDLPIYTRRSTVTEFLSTLSLRRATRRVLKCDNRAIISIHALLAESDVWADTDYNLSDIISIHALLAESDHQLWEGSQQPDDFYPRSPCGERHFDTLSALAPEEFLSTLSLRRATHTGVSTTFRA